MKLNSFITIALVTSAISGFANAQASKGVCRGALDIYNPCTLSLEIHGGVEVVKGVGNAGTSFYMKDGRRITNIDGKVVLSTSDRVKLTFDGKGNPLTISR